MNRIRKYSKRIAAILIISLCINTHSAIVSDNDGSAFITKAEFESLKTSFQEQVDNYEASVDGKIDGAIASYLAGITLSNKQQWYSEYGVDKFVFYARDVATSLPKIKFDAYYAYKNTNVTNSEYGAWSGGLEWKSTSPKTSTTSLCIGNPIGTNEFKLKRYDKNIELKGAFTFVKDGASTSVKNTYIARNGGVSWLWIYANYDSSKNKTYMRGLNVQMKDAVYGDSYTPPIRISAYTNTSYIDITTKNGLRSYNFARYDNSDNILTDMNNEIYGTKWAGAWAIENTSVTNCVPIAQRNTVKFFCINPDDSNATWYFDNLVPEVGKISPTLTPHLALNSLNNFAGSTTWNVQRRYIEGNSSAVKSAMGCDVITEYKYRNKAAENRKWYSWSKNFMIAPTSGYFAANKIRQYLDEEARWYLSSGILLSKKCESSKLVLVVNGKTPVASDTIKIAASRNPFTNGISTTSTADYYKINGKTEPAEIKSNVNTKISIAAEKGKECYLMVTSSKGQDITFEILKNQSYWEIE